MDSLKNMKKLALAIVIGMVGTYAQAADEDVEIPVEELARESVLPVFDNPTAVKNRNVSLAKHIEIGGFFGTAVNEAFVDQTLMGAWANYHLSEFSGIQFLGAVINSQSSSYVPQLNEVFPASPPNYQLLPKPKHLLLLSYELTPFYGKMSITKQTVFNLSTFFTGGVGMLGLGDTSTPVLGLGLGQNIFFGSRWGMKIDMRGLMYQGVNPVSVSHTNRTTTPPVSEYERVMTLNIAITAGLIYLL
ncbi:MAG: outer membrane beta-barrel domain-containing protein [Bdellovibrionales bacterium]